MPAGLHISEPKFARDNELGEAFRRFTWDHYDPRAALLPLPAIAIALSVGVLAGHPGAAMVAGGGAQSAGFGAFQKPLFFRGGPVLFATLGMAVSAVLGCLLAQHTLLLLLVAAVCAFLYGMAGAISSPAQWVGQQCCTFLVVSSAFPSSVEQALWRGAGVFAGGVLQFLVIELLWHYFPPADTADENRETHPPGWRLRAIRCNLTIESPIFRFALRLVAIAIVSILVYRFWEYPNAYWIPMTALILPKPDMKGTLQRDVARIAGTIVGAGVATLLAAVIRPHAPALIALVLIYMWASYALQNVNYAAYIAMLTGYIAFDLAIGKQPEILSAWHRILATTEGGIVAIAAYLVHLHAFRLWRAKQTQNA